MATKEEILDAIANMTVLELSELLSDFEEKFGVTIPDDEVKNLKTVGDAVAFIERSQG